MTWTAILPLSAGLPMTGNQSVDDGAESKTVTLDTEITVPYAVVGITTTWETEVAVVEKTSTTFSVRFGTPAYGAQSFDWRVEVI